MPDKLRLAIQRPSSRDGHWFEVDHVEMNYDQVQELATRMNVRTMHCSETDLKLDDFGVALIGALEE